MEASISSQILAFPSSKNLSRNAIAATQHFISKPRVNFICPHRRNHLIRTRRLPARIQVFNDVSAAVDPASAEVTWRIVVGAIAGVTPFVVAGVEFSKRIVAQKRCEVCGGSGLVLKDKYYFRCPGCGGFLPWQSWKRFISG